ncbi:MAG: phosphotransferase [Eubacteriales bacterium]|nr:phosphotransferase [Eubacteriales bacterium]
MNKEILLLRSMYENNKVTQRDLVKQTGLALGTVNTVIKNAIDGGLIKKNTGYSLTAEGLKILEPYKVDCAVIMAAGFGSRFVPLSFETPKGLLEVFGEPMVERQIRQLHEAGITDIAIVVGYMKEKFEYLIDKFGVKLIYNPDFGTRNNIGSIEYAYDFLYGKNAYILSSDNWIRENMYHAYEAHAWYSSKYAEGRTSEWTLVTDKKGRITDTYPGGRDCDYMFGPAYFSREFGESFLPVLKKYCSMPGTEDYYWENVLMAMLNGEAKKRINAYFGRIPEIALCDKIEMYINRQPEDNVYEFENLEELRKFDPKYREDSGSKAMQLVAGVFNVPESSVVNIRRLKAGMTNNSWLFTVDGKSYICRIPGEGTEKLINRREEGAVFKAVEPLGITEKVIYFNENNGYKISEFYENSHNADFSNAAELKVCMKKLRKLHESGVKVSHSFDIRKKINFYEGLCGKVMFEDYPEVRKNADALLAWVDKNKLEPVLAHIDPVCDNFIFLPDGNAEAEDGVRLIDWEYSGMCDPLMDLGMCAIYSYMEEAETEQLMEYYFGREATRNEKLLVYAYMALGGLLWSLWGLYKESLGIQFSDYTIKMYRYFKKYCKYVL